MEYQVVVAWAIDAPCPEIVKEQWNWFRICDDTGRKIVYASDMPALAEAALYNVTPDKPRRSCHENLHVNFFLHTGGKT